MIRRAFAWTALAALAATLVVAGYWLLFTTFMVYDDEGYVLYSLKSYAEHGALYDRVYTQYGPFFYIVWDGLHRLLGFEWNNTNGRLLTLLLWFVIALYCSALVWRQTRSSGAAAFTLAAVFTCLWVMIHEPMHPGGIVGLLVAVAAYLGTVHDLSREARIAALIGAIGAALTLTKINVGGFLLISSAAWLVVHSSSAGMRRWGGWVIAGVIVLLPWALMRSLLAQGWVWQFALVSTLGSLGVLLAGRTSAEPAAGKRIWAAFIAGGAIVTIITLTIVFWRGTSPAGLIDGVLLDPLHHPGVYFFAFNWRVGTLAMAAVAFVLVCAHCCTPAASLISRTIMAIRGAAGLAFALSILNLLPISQAAFGMSYGVTLAGICVLPLRRDADGMRDARVRQWLGLLLVLQFLHAYPVAGSQINWATFLWVPLLTLAVRDAWLALGLRWKWMPACGTLAGLGLGAFMGGKLLDVGWTNRHQGEALNLPGAESIIVPDDTVFGLRIMAQNARVHGGVLFSLPGIYSLNLWTGRPTPTLANATHWFSLLSSEQQREVISRLRADPRAVLVVQTDTLKYIVDHGFRLQGELAEYLGREFKRAFEVDSYAFWVHKDREIAPLSTGVFTPRTTASRRQRLELVLDSPGGAISAVDLLDLTDNGRIPLLTLSRANATLDATPLTDTGLPFRSTQTGQWEDEWPQGIIRLGIDFSVEAPEGGRLLAVVTDASGRRLAAVRILR